MKSPEYVFNVTRLYREVLDRGEGISVEDYEELVRKAQLGFARTTTSGWFSSAHGARLLEPGLQGHRGAFMGKVERVQGRQMVLRLEGDLSLHDGLAFHDERARELAAFPVLKILRSGREVRVARKGDTVSVEVPVSASAAMPRQGQEIRQLSSRFLDLPQPRETSFPMYKIPLDFEVTFGSGGLLTFQAPGFPDFSRRVEIAPATVKKSFFPILESLLGESGESAFCPGAISFENETGLPDDGIFVRPSELKRVKNELYKFLEQAFPARANSGRGLDDRPTEAGAETAAGTQRACPARAPGGDRAAGHVADSLRGRRSCRARAYTTGSVRGILLGAAPACSSGRSTVDRSAAKAHRGPSADADCGRPEQHVPPGIRGRLVGTKQCLVLRRLLPVRRE